MRMVMKTEVFFPDFNFDIVGGAMKLNNQIEKLHSPPFCIDNMAFIAFTFTY